MANFANSESSAPMANFNAASASVNPKVAGEDLRFKMISALQSSLDIDDVLLNFYQMIQKALPIAGIEYQHSERQIRCSLGAVKIHKCHYNLNFSQRYLGEISFSRSKRFSEQELELIESFTGLLMTPLRNAILYRDALENSLRDSLTCVGNRAAFEINIKREFSLARRNNQPLSLIVADLDHFKSINDQFGHQIGDQALHHSATHMKTALRQTDQIFRFGGEEFVIILNNTAHHQAMMVAERIRSQLECGTLNVANTIIPITLSLGVATLRDCDSREALFERADTAMYAAKHYGRNCCMSAELSTIDTEVKACP